MNKLIRRVIVCILLIVIGPTISSAHHEKLQRPPLPENKHEQKTAIVQLKEHLTTSEIEKLLKPYPNLKLRYTFQHIFHGFSVTGPKHELDKIAELGLTQQIYPSYTYQLQVSSYPNVLIQEHNNIDLIGTKEIRRLNDKNGRPLTGKGIKVGVIDTGIDYTHPDLRKSYVKGYDFVDNDSDPMETVNMGPNDTFHGTHVAGVIAANGKMKGVACEAKIYAYRALGPGGFGTTEMIIAAIEQAIKDGVDVLNLSLGTSINGPDLPTSLALDKAVEHGIVAVTSNGNSGPDLWTVGTPGTSHKAISVGASTPNIKVPYLDYFQKQFRLTPFSGSKQWNIDRSYMLVDGGLGRVGDFQNKDAVGKMAVIKRGKLTFTEKVKNAEKHGAKAVIIYNNEKGDVLGQLEGEIKIPVAFISKKDGERLLKLMRERPMPAKITLKEEQDTLADFSSRGPVTFNWEIKPDVVAPGVAIVSTVPGGYMPLQGTSMASPHVAGASAILKQANPHLTPEQMKAIFMNTSIPLKRNSEDYYDTFEQGAGRIRIDKAIKTKVIIDPGALIFGKVEGTNFEENKKRITIENVSDQPIRITFQVPERSDEIGWHLPTRFMLQPNEKRQLTIGLEVKNEHKVNEIFNGYLTMFAGSDTIHVPYLYVTTEPDYPRIMAFSVEDANHEDLFQYEVYLPGGAEEFGIALFDPDTYRFIDYLDWEENVRRGLISRTMNKSDAIPKGTYIAIAFAKKAEKEDYIEQIIEIQ